MESDKLEEAHGGQAAPPAEGSTGAPSGENELPAEPKKGGLAVLIPRAATIAWMGATWIFASRSEVLCGADALLFPFLSRHAPSRTRATYLISNTMSPVLIWTVEANRGSLTMEKIGLQFLAIAGINWIGIERVAPICFLCSMDAWNSAKPSEDRMISPEEAKAVLPATLVGYVLPAALVSLVPLTATGISQSYFKIEGAIALAFHLAPLNVLCLMKLIGRAIRHVERWAGKAKPRDKATPGDKISTKNQDALDVFHSLRSAYAVSFAMQAAQHLYTIARNLIQAPRGQRSVVAVFWRLFTYPIIPRQQFPSILLYSTATLGFGLYTVWELRRRGKVSDRDAKRTAAGVVAGQVLFGPGATYAGLWWWREGVLARTRQRT